ncbi:hypothetical protein MMC34_007308 [Xylographa carneopallida]|nr:hypothetical protein [Xylographa carneopallida]
MSFNPTITVRVPSTGRSSLSSPPLTFRISATTLATYLPLLPLAPTLYANRLVPPSTWSPPMRTAFLWLLTHLTSLSRHGTSASLLHSLEASHKRRTGKNHTVPALDRLAHLLRRYGAPPTLSAHLATFVARHCEPMLRRHPSRALMCLRALRAARADVGGVLACLSCHPPAAHRLLRLADRVEESLGEVVLPGDVRGELVRLVGQKEEREGRGWDVGWGSGGFGGGGRGRNMGRRSSRMVLRGDAMEWEELAAVWRGEGHRILVDVTGREDVLGGWGLDDGGWGDEDWGDEGWGAEGRDHEWDDTPETEWWDGEEEDGFLSDESDEDFFHFGEGAARRAFPRERRAVEGRRQRKLEWGGEGAPMGGWGERDRVGVGRWEEGF